MQFPPLARPVVLAAVAGLAAGHGTAQAAADAEFFEREVRPLLHRRCVECHGPDKQKGGLRLDHGSFVLRGGDSGPALVAGDPSGSRLVTAIRRQDPDLQMPPKTALPATEIEVLVRWIAAGASWPDEPMPAAIGAPAAFDLAARRANHWAWRPLVLPPVPDAGDGWALGPIDRFVAVQHARHGLRPGPAAGPAVLLRRLSFDLTGLPPTPDELAAFQRAPNEAGYERAVDRLLASPHFGERWARHWLDLMRWSETLGHEFDYALPNAWRYRDYVVRAFQYDLPYDQFVREHLAGDLLPGPRRGVDGANESVIGTASWWFGEQGHSPVDLLQHTADRVDNQIDVFGKAFLGLTVACARCHDHKFDAISQRDYHALAGIVRSSRYVQAPLGPGVSDGTVQGDLEERQRRLAELAEVVGLPPVPPTPEPEDRPDDLAIADFAKHGFERWTRVGSAFGPQPCTDVVTVADGPQPARHRLRGGWAHSGALGRPLQGVLQSPDFRIERRYLHVLAMGRAARVTVFPAGFQLVRDPIYGGLKRLVDTAVPQWLTFDLDMWRGQLAVLECSDLAVADLADTVRSEGYGTDGWLAVRTAVLSDRREPPALRPGEPELAAPAPEALAAERGAFDAALAELEAAAVAAAATAFVPAMADGAGIDQPLLIRGNPRQPGAAVPRGFLTALAGESPRPIAHGSGRLELAAAVLADDNPLPARVMVNRVWHHLLGRGIVATVDNLGHLGERPTHPELLDWLAATFRADGWSVKRLIRRIVLSRTYRLASAPVAGMDDRDPDNRWLHRASVRRLEAEALRDSMLLIAGRLHRTIGGPSVPTHITPFMSGRGRPGASGPLDGAGRRSLYLEVRRNFLSPFLLAFDAPPPFATVGARSRTNVPAQALALANDPFVHAMAEAWAQAVLAAPERDDRQRIEHMHLQAFARPPTAAELQACLEFVRDGGPAAWTGLAHVLFQLVEFSYRP